MSTSERFTGNCISSLQKARINFLLYLLAKENSELYDRLGMRMPLAGIDQFSQGMNWRRNERDNFVLAGDKGVLQWNWNEPYGEAIIEYLYVHPTARRKGIGTELMNNAMDWIRKEHPDRAGTVLFIMPNNAGAKQFFANFGFETIIQEALMSKW